MPGQLHAQAQIPGLSAPHTRLALPGEPNDGAVGGAGGDLHFIALILLDDAPVGGALAHRQHDLTLRTAGHLLKGDMHDRLDRAPLLCARRARAPGTRPAESVETKPAAWPRGVRARAAKECIKEVAKIRLAAAALAPENILKPLGAAAKSPPLPAGRRAKALRALVFLPVLAELIVLLARLRVLEHLVGLVDLLELLLGARLLAHIRVILARKFAIRLLDLVLRSAAIDVKNLIIILKFYGHEWGLICGIQKIRMHPKFIRIGLTHR